MQKRCIAVLPLAALMTFLLFVMTSSIVSGLEQRFAQGSSVKAVEIYRHETDCEFLERRIEEIAVDLRSCDAFPGCLESKNICPASMREEFGIEYRRLRNEVLSRCSELPTYATRVSASCSSGFETCGTQNCNTLRLGTETASPAAVRPGTFVF